MAYSMGYPPSYMPQPYPAYFEHPEMHPMPYEGYAVQEGPYLPMPGHPFPNPPMEPEFQIDPVTGQPIYMHPGNDVSQITGFDTEGNHACTKV